ncbi:MAG TPA: SGNH/GDSL hydrolase family protein, partial [Fibrobacteria bacterium]|nr:SGNH/GDSL hydrolase family protein [Fibrobacteria bacterium]
TASVIVSADDSRIQYMGRFDQANPKRPRFDWPGTRITFRFTGPKASVRLSGGRNDFNVFVDGEARPRLSLVDGKSEYEVASGLGPGEHTVVISKRTEAYYGIASFEGVVLEDGHGLATPPERPTRRLLFIGDSYTVGYGNEATSLDCSDLRPFDDNWQAWGPVAARSLGAEYHVTAVSGLGMVHNYADTKPLSDEPFPALFDRTLAGSDAPTWDFTAWTPHAVAVALGTNDFSTAVKPTEDQYVSAYKTFVGRLRSHFPFAEIVLVVYSGDTYQERYVETLVKDLNTAGDAKVRRFTMPTMGSDLGCHYHPNVAAHRRFADAVSPLLSSLFPPTGLVGRPNSARPGAAKASGASPTPLFPRVRNGKADWLDANGRPPGR